MATVRYTNIEGQIVAEKRGGVRRTYVPDVLGSTMVVVGAGETVAASYRFWPFGEVVSTSSPIQIPFLYVGTYGYRKPGLGPTYVRARWLTVTRGRWLSPDPLELTLQYEYVRSQPTRLIDPSGLTCCAPSGGTSQGDCEKIVGFINDVLKHLPHSDKKAQIPKDWCRFLCLQAKSFDECAINIVDYACGKAGAGFPPIKPYCDLLSKLLPILKKACEDRNILNNPQKLSDCIGKTRIVSRCAQCCGELFPDTTSDEYDACLAACKSKKLR